jgi:hypothetical protein
MNFVDISFSETEIYIVLQYIVTPFEELVRMCGELSVRGCCYTPEGSIPFRMADDPEGSAAQFCILHVIQHCNCSAACSWLGDAF